MVLPQRIITDEQTTVHYEHSYFYILLLAKLETYEILLIKPREIRMFTPKTSTTSAYLTYKMMY